MGSEPEFSWFLRLGSDPGFDFGQEPSSRPVLCEASARIPGVLSLAFRWRRLSNPYCTQSVPSKPRSTTTVAKEKLQMPFSNGFFAPELGSRRCTCGIYPVLMPFSR